MKKRIALLCGVLVLITAVFAACSTTPTSRAIRWDEGEKSQFNITLADFNADTNSKELFNSYKDNDKTYFKDAIINAQESINMGNADELRPLNAKGTYTMEISAPSTTTRRLDTKQVIYTQYDTAKLRELNCLDKLADYIVAADDESNPFVESNGATTLRSECTTWVVFAHDSNQLPQTSFIENKGYYIGATHQGASNYKYETTYDFDKRVVTIKTNDGEAETHKIGLRKGGACIDSNQLLLYIRSLDKSSVAFSDNPSVAVYNPVSKTLATATFALNRQFNAALNNNGANFYTTTHLVQVAVSGTPFMTQFNLPDLTTNDGGHDYLTGATGAKVCKYSTVKFRAGWYSYELSEYAADTLAALKALQNKENK